MRTDNKLTDGDRTGLKHARVCCCADLDTLIELAHGFNHLVRHRTGHRIEEWINQAAIAGQYAQAAPIGGAERDAGRVHGVAGRAGCLP